MNINVQVDDKAVTDALKDFAKQIPFAMSKALNDTANDVQRSIQDSLSQRFTLRRPDFIKRTIKRNREDFATKTKLEAIVRVDPTRDILAKFEEGGTKRPTKGTAIAIPTENVRRTKAQIISQQNRPAFLVATGKAISYGGKLLLKKGRGRGATFLVAYVFKKAVRIPKSLGFVTTANASVDRNWVRRAEDAVARALATLR